MIDQVDDMLVRWASSALQSVGRAMPVVVAGAIDPAADAVQIILADSRPVADSRGTGRPDFQISCRYVIVAAIQDPMTAHRVLGALMLSAMETPVLDGARLDLNLDPDFPPPGWWTAFGVKPLPAIAVQVRVRQSRTTTPVDPVRAPIRVDRSPVGVLRGTVVGFNRVPVAGAEVTVPPFPTVYRTDYRGQFTTGPVPVGDAGTNVEIRARGVLKTVRVMDTAPVTVSFESLGRPLNSSP